MENNVDLELSLFKNPIEKFKEHLQLPNNQRIIFSGKFGHGKTTFLRHFFEDATQTKNFQKSTPYNVISLFPVNYSVASNEDIFKYIKYDIILEMLARNYEIEDAVISYKETLPTYLRKNWLKVVTTIVSMVPKVGKDVIESFDKVNNLKEEFFKFHDDQNLEQNKGDQFSNFLEEIQKTQGSIFEEDLITKLIEEVLKDKLKKDSKKENVLIIDDLDRIDPEHIFRILNVFAAHFDKRRDSKNKFGFDKIILVCDIENIRNIFAAKYGMLTDFNGYIDKFYSNEIFHFRYREEMEDYAKRIFYNVSVVDREGWGNESQSSYYSQKYFVENSQLFADLFQLLFDNKQIDLRNVVKYKYLPFKYLGSHKSRDFNIAEEDCPFLPALRYLVQIKGDFLGLKNSFERCELISVPYTRVRRYCVDLLYILTMERHRKNTNDPHFIWQYRLQGRLLTIKFKREGDMDRQELINVVDSVNNSYSNFTETEFSLLLKNTLDLLHLHKYL